MAMINVGKTNLAIHRGEEDLTMWDEEELRRGYKRDKNGKWTGRPPKIVPRAIHDELARRMYDEATQILKNDLVAAVQLFGDLVRNPDVDPAVRLKAAQVIVERVMGKAQQNVKLDVGVQAKWEQAIAHSIVSIPAELAEAIVVGSYEADDDRAGEFTEPG